MFLVLASWSSGTRIKNKSIALLKPKTKMQKVEPFLCFNYIYLSFTFCKGDGKVHRL